MFLVKRKDLVTKRKADVRQDDVSNQESMPLKRYTMLAR